MQKNRKVDFLLKLCYTITRLSGREGFMANVKYYVSDEMSDQEREMCLERRTAFRVFKWWYTTTCAAALLALFAVEDKKDRAPVLGFAAMNGIIAYACGKRSNNIKLKLENEIKRQRAHPIMTQNGKREYYAEQQKMDKQENDGLKLIGAGAVCTLLGNPVLGGGLVTAGILHGALSEKYSQKQSQILDRYLKFEKLFER